MLALVFLANCEVRAVEARKEAGLVQIMPQGCTHLCMEVHWESDPNIHRGVCIE